MSAKEKRAIADGLTREAERLSLAGERQAAEAVYAVRAVFVGTAREQELTGLRARARRLLGLLP